MERPGKLCYNDKQVGPEIGIEQGIGIQSGIAQRQDLFGKIE